MFSFIILLLVEEVEEVIEEGDDAQEIDEEDHGEEGSPAFHLEDTRFSLEDNSGSQEVFDNNTAGKFILASSFILFAC
ncbi:hypothetical protein Pcinc_027702 [Petrolisthes cinctipes]|uniref:Uncharacterized protein n=1 Tax=Petrolisthes cinctipes TaxID=88211 RepID=A0AAE1F3G2_PETCI|nr:hypothetical protein Pcinc_027702 [Petrolisthes cinctipes]